MGRWRNRGTAPTRGSRLACARPRRRTRAPPENKEAAPATVSARAVSVSAANGELTISCLMGKIGNGESKGSLRSITEKFALFCSPLGVGPEQGHQFVRRSECPFAQVWWKDGLYGLELLAWIAARVDFGSGQLAVSEPEGYLSNVLRCL